MAWETREAKKAKDYERDRTKEKKRAEEQVSIDNISVRKYFFRLRGAVILTYGSGTRRPVNYRIHPDRDPTWIFCSYCIKICCQIGGKS
jgi:hypothetical protein